MKRVLVCSLDWGLGHATRCIPVIRELKRQGAEVFLASSGDAGVLLKKEFPHLSYHELPGYRPRYQRQGSLVMAIASQLRKFLHVIRLEHQEVEALVKNLGLEIVIADNRYGCYSAHAESVFLSHQLYVRLPRRWHFMEPLVNRNFHQHIRRFQRVWVPDQPMSNLTNHFLDSRISFSYVGWLSRFSRQGQSGTPVDVMAVLSGPEPQRSLFEAVLRRQLEDFSGTVLLVTGQPAATTGPQNGKVEVVHHLDTAMMEQRMRGARVIIARSGYSTIMDLITLKKKAVFVPTPEQPEQTWLAEQLMRADIAFSCDQKNFVLREALEKFDVYQGMGSLVKEEGLLTKEIAHLLS